MRALPERAGQDPRQDCRQTVDNTRKSVAHPFYVKGLLKYGAFYRIMR